MKVYSMNIGYIDAGDKKWQKYLSEKRIEKVCRLKKSNKKSQSIGAELLLNYAVKQEVKTDSNVEWDTDKNGKLYLVNYKNLYVNLSHSRYYAVCAIHNKPIGIDLQYCRKCDMKLADRFFTTDETDWINQSSDKNSAFFEVWTKKESFVKAVGMGLVIPLNSFSVLSDCIEYNGEVYRFKEYRVSQTGYKMFVCYLS